MIAIDGSAQDTPHRYRGVGHYVRSLLCAMARIRNEAPEGISVLRLKGLGGRVADQGPFPVKYLRRPLGLGVDAYWLLNRFLLNHELNRLKPTLFHATEHKGLPESGAFKTVVTGLDLIPFKFPKHYLGKSWDRLVWWYNPRLLRRADHIVAISRATKTDLVSLLGIAPEKVSVTYPGIDLEAIMEEPEDLEPRAPLPGKYFLYVGAMDYRKNVDRLVRAFSRIGNHVDENLLFLGRLPKQQQDRLLAQASRLGLDSRLELRGFVPEEEIHCYYRRATALLFPSLAEGFGLPIVQAMARKCPVLTSNFGAMAEVAGEAALLVDPYSETGLARGMESLANDQELRKSLKDLGLARARGFTWERCARDTFACYRKVLGS